MEEKLLDKPHVMLQLVFALLPSDVVPTLVALQALVQLPQPLTATTTDLALDVLPIRNVEALIWEHKPCATLVLESAKDVKPTLTVLEQLEELTATLVEFVPIVLLPDALTMLASQPVERLHNAAEISVLIKAARLFVTLLIGFAKTLVSVTPFVLPDPQSPLSVVVLIVKPMVFA